MAQVAKSKYKTAQNGSKRLQIGCGSGDLFDEEAREENASNVSKLAQIARK